MSQIVRYIFILLFALNITSAYAQGLKNRQLLGKQVSLLMPDILKADANNPDNEFSFAAYTDQDQSLRFSYIVYGKIKDSSKVEDNMASMEREFVTRIPFHKLINKGVKDVNGKKVAFFEVENTDKDQPYKYNLVFATDVNGELVAFVYSAASQHQSAWKATATQVMQSLRIAKN